MKDAPETLVSSLMVDENGWVKNAFNYCWKAQESVENDYEDSIDDECVKINNDVLPHVKRLQRMLNISSCNLRSEARTSKTSTAATVICTASFENMQLIEGLSETLQTALEEIMNMKPQGKSNYVHPPFWITQISFNSLKILSIIMGRMLFLEPSGNHDDQKHNTETSLTTEQKTDGSNIESLYRLDRSRKNKTAVVVIYNHTHYDFCTDKNSKRILSDYHFLMRRLLSPSNIGGDANNEKDDDKTNSFSLYQEYFNYDIHRKIFNISSPAAVMDNTMAILLNNDSLRRFGKLIDTFLLEPLCSKSSDFITRHQTARVNQLGADIVSTLRATGMFRFVKLSIYGSYLTKLSVTGSDVDLSIDLPGVPLRNEKKKYAFALRDLLSNNLRFRRSRRGFFSNIEAIPWARIPIVKGCYEYSADDTGPAGRINFDICFDNLIAVANSQLIQEYTELHRNQQQNAAKVRNLMILVKLWGKKHGIDSAKNGYLSSYSWINLVIFYLQCIGYIPNLQCKTLIQEHIAQFKDMDHSKIYVFKDCVAGLDTCFLQASAVRDAGIWKHPNELQDISLFGLLYGFFHFYSSNFPQSILAVSIRLGQPILLKSVFSKACLWRICIEDPFETHQTSVSHDLGRHLERNTQQIISQKVDDAFQELTTILSNLTISCGTNERIHQDNFHDHILMLYRFLAHEISESFSYSPTIPLDGVQLMSAFGRNQNLAPQKNNSKSMPLGEGLLRTLVLPLLHAHECSNAGRVADVRVNSGIAPTIVVHKSLDVRTCIQSTTTNFVNDDKVCEEKIQANSQQQNKIPLSNRAPAEDICILNTAVPKTSIETTSVQKEETISNISYAKMSSFRTNPTQRAETKGTVSKDGKVKGRQTLLTVSLSASKLKNQKKCQQQSKIISSNKTPAEDICSQDSAVDKTSREITSVQKEETTSIGNSAKIASNRTNPTQHAASEDSTSKDGKMKGKQAAPIASHAVNIPVSAAPKGQTAMSNKQTQVPKRIPKVAGKDKMCFKCGKFGHIAAGCGKLGSKS